MDFFKSVFSDNSPEPSSASSNSQTTPTSPSNPQPHALNPNPTNNNNSWTTLFKTLASKSDSVIETYRRDLQDFASGLKSETRSIVMDLPTRLESGAALAQDSLESVGQALDNVGSAVAHIITQGNDSILDDYDSDSNSNSNSELYDYDVIHNNLRQLDLNSKPYSRVDAVIRSMQCDVKTYCEEVEDLGDYNEWKLGFNLEGKNREIEDLIEENGVIREIYDGVVPGRVDRETFWGRYFYRVYRVMKAEEARLKLVMRAVSGEEEEDLSWDVEDDEEGGGSGGFEVNTLSKREVEEGSLMGKNGGESEGGSEEKGLEVEHEDKRGVVESKSDGGGDEKGTIEEGLNESESSGGDDKMGLRSDDKVGSEGKSENSDFSVVSSQKSFHGEEDIGWDEIEDIGSGDESKMVVAAHGSPNKADLQLSAADEDEDLTWDIEDDDEPVVKS